MKISRFDYLIDKNKIQVFLLQSTNPFPFSLGVHTWFVVSDFNGIHRWELGTRFYKDRGVNQVEWGNLYKDRNEPFEGMELLPFFSIVRFSVTLIGMIEGNEGSLADRMKKFIEKESPNYKYKDHYSLFGPNSNTYTQWVLNNFPESQIKLSWRAIGKNYNFV